MGKNIVALFDFCDTLFDGQSINLFLDYLYKKEKNWLIKTQIKARKLFSNSPKDDDLSLEHKNFLFSPLKGKDKKLMETIAFDFNNEILLKREHKNVVERLHWHQKLGHTIIILSGGFDIYLQYYAQTYNIEKVVSTALLFENDNFLGIDEECLGAKKITKLKKILFWEDVDWEHSYSYSDSKSDIPLLSLTGNSFVIHNKQDISWMKHEWKIINVSK
ncbi:MAG: HAD-IB family hydrolase [Bacteroidetes bacterium]|nr:HAD-IB family hydrolase [Bacteroidota bacterium]